MLYYKRQGSYVVCNELLGRTVGWVIVRDTDTFGVWEFEPGSFFVVVLFLSFFSLVSFFRVRLRLSVRVSVRVRVRVRF